MNRKEGLDRWMGELNYEWKEGCIGERMIK